MAHKAYRRRHLIEDGFVIAASIVVAVFIVRSGVVHSLIASFQDFGALGSFAAGIFFTSIFTTAPAMAVLGELSQARPIWEVVVLGGLGAMMGDYLIFRFVRDRVGDDVLYLLSHSGAKRVPAIFRTRLFRRLVPFVGALIIASPLPDELGLAMLGISKVSTRNFFLLSFTFNAIGILLIAWAANAWAW